MKATLLSGLVLLSVSAMAHEDHDWREDYMAYLSVEYTIPLAPMGMKSRTNIKRVQSSRLDMKFFKEKLEVLTGEKPFTFKGEQVEITERKSQKRLDWARAFLAEEYTKLGFTVAQHPFGKGTNFIAEKPGTTNPGSVLILSSHIDSVGNKGANDNGTGTIGLLTVARELAKSQYGATIRILGFDREEVGLKGSDAYVATLLDKEKIIGNINFEMMGVNSRDDGAFHLIDCGRKESLFLSKAINASVSSMGLALNVVKTCTDRSDHASFWRRNIPAVVISENFFGGDADPCYHARCDVMDERLNYGYMDKILSAVLDASEKLIK
ncbi:MAG TPA: M28 family peptidase [Bacteriovoracaceae bacterium]|nr:M28 family peptidase [Bacteriovoracaceae bacterium]